MDPPPFTDRPATYPHDPAGVATWGTEIDPESAVVPIVFHYRSTQYVRVAPERLSEWEDYFVKNVGLQPDVASSASRLGLDHRSATMSGSHHGWDDADFV
jgi:hypothetical protein